MSSFGGIDTSTGRPRLSSKIMGVDIGELVKTLAEIKGLPAKKKEAEIAFIDKQTKAFGALKAKLDGLMSAANSLRRDYGRVGATSVFDRKAAIVQTADGTAPGSHLGIQVGTGAQVGTFSLTVMQTASTDRLTAQVGVADRSADSPIGAGTLILNGKADKAITLDGTESLQQIVDRINQSDRVAATGVRARILRISDTDHRLALEATTTGKAIQIGGTQGLLDPFSMTSTAPGNRLSKSFAPRPDTSEFKPLAGMANPALRVNGIDVALGAEDTLDDIATKIAAASGGRINASATKDNDGNLDLSLEGNGEALDLSQASEAVLSALGLKPLENTGSKDDLVADAASKAIAADKTAPTAASGGTLTIKHKDKTAAVAIAANASLDDIVAAINAQLATDGLADVEAGTAQDGDGNYRLTLFSKDGAPLTYDAGGTGLTLGSRSYTGTMQATAAYARPLTAGGTVKIANQDVTFAAGDSLETIRAKIDALNSIGASVTGNAKDGFRLAITHDSDRAVAIDDPDGVLAPLGLFARTAEDTLKAKMLFNGVQVVRDSNSVNDLVHDVKIELFRADAGNVLTVNVNHDLEAVQGAVLAFAKKYNELMDAIDEQRRFTEGGELAEGALLGKNSTFRTVVGQVRTAITQAVPGLGQGGLGTLGDIGLGIGENNRMLIALDDTDEDMPQKVKTRIADARNRLDDMLINRFDDMRRLFNTDVTSTDSRFVVTRLPTSIGAAEAGRDISVRLTKRDEITTPFAGSLTYQTGNQTITVAAGLGLAANDAITFALDGDSSKTITAKVNSYDAATGELSFKVESFTGTALGSASGWTMKREGALSASVNYAMEGFTLSATSMEAKTGTKYVSLPTGRTFHVGQTLTFADASDPYGRFMTGTLAGYDPQKGWKVEITSAVGSGSALNWRVTGYGTIGGGIGTAGGAAGSVTPQAVSVATGQKTLRLSAGLDFQAGQDVELTSGDDGAAGMYLRGKVVSYDKATGDIVVDATSAKGSGSFNNWTVAGFNNATVEKTALGHTVRGGGAFAGFAATFTGSVANNATAGSRLNMTVGYGDKMDALLEAVVPGKDNKGLLVNEEGTLKAKKELLQTQINKIGQHVQQETERMMLQFLAAEKAVSQLNSIMQTLKAYTNGQNKE